MTSEWLLLAGEMGGERGGGGNSVVFLCNGMGTTGSMEKKMIKSCPHAISKNKFQVHW